VDRGVVRRDAAALEGGHILSGVAPSVAPSVSSDVRAVLGLRGITKLFGPTRAVDELDLDIRAGEVHALLGENGAGKSTVARIAAGVMEPTSGTVLLDGEEAALRSVREAEAQGILLIPQELQLFDPLSVAENLFVGRPRPRRPWGIVDGRRMRAVARQTLAQLGVEFDVRVPVERLSSAGRQLVAIARALILRVRVLIMDEPTAALDDWEAARLLSVVGELRRTGVGVLYVSHRLHEVREVADVVTVMRDGRAVASGATSKLQDQTLIRHMVGRPVEQLTRRGSRATDRLLLRTSGLSRRGSFSDISLELHEGEVVGIAGLMGSGRSSLGRALFGQRPATSGSIEVRGRPVRLRSVPDAIRAGIGFVPEERQSQGLFMPFTAVRNVSLVRLADFVRGGLLVERREEDFATRELEPLSIRGDIHASVRELSGGNQQKVLVAKWLAAGPSVLVLDEPTRGVDVGVRSEIYRIIDRLAGRGTGILLISSDMKELQILCDRIVVMRAGRIVAEFAGDDATDIAIGTAALGVSEALSE
jgi:ABC-type sugar transport system ATPase subunit